MKYLHTLTGTLIGFYTEAKVPLLATLTPSKLNFILPLSKVIVSFSPTPFFFLLTSVCYNLTEILITQAGAWEEEEKSKEASIT